MDLSPQIATGSYRAFTPDWGVGVSTSVGKPRGWHGSKDKGIVSKPFINAIAPWGIFNHRPAYNESTFRRLYDERLHAKASEIDGHIERLATEDPGQPLVMLCWCSLSHPDAYCHRRIFARWAESRYGIIVPELALTVLPAVPTV